MDIEEIRTFIEVANVASFSKAAEVLHVVQSTVSNRIRALEEYTGVRLLIRDKTGIRLTNAGEAFLKYARQMSELDTAALRDLHFAEKYTDTFRVASVQWLNDYALRHLVASFSAAHPEIAVELTIAHGEEIIPRLRDHVYDCALISYKINTQGLVSFPFDATKVVFIGAADAFGSLAGGITKEDLQGMSLIYSDIWDNYMSEVSEGALPDITTFRARCNMLDSAKTLCLAGIGCCFLPELMVREELANGTLIRIPIQGVREKTVRSYLVYNKKRVESKVVKDWMEFVFQRGR